MAKKPPEKPAKKREKVEPFTQELRCLLSPAEVEQRNDRATYLLITGIPSAELVFTELREKHRKELRALNKEMRQVAHEARERATVREVQCERRFLYDECKLQEVRKDTGEVLFERPLNPGELQQELFEEDGDFDDAFGAEEG